MTATYVDISDAPVSQGGTVSSPGVSTITSGTAFPSGGSATLAVVFSHNALDEPPLFDADTWNLSGDSIGGAGSYGASTGKRIASAFWKPSAPSSPEVFTNGGANDVQNAIHSYLLGYNKSRTYWEDATSVEGKYDGGSTFAATFNAHLPFTDGDEALLLIITPNDAVNPAGIVLTIPGTTQGTSTTGLATQAFSNGNNCRVSVRRVAITGTSNGTPPSVTSSTVFTGAALLVRIRDTDTAPVFMSAGVDKIARPGETFTLDSSASTGLAAGRTWSLQSGPAAYSLSSATAVSPTATCPPTLDGGTQVWRVTDDTTGNFDEVSVLCLPSEYKVKMGGVMVPLMIRGEV